MIFLSKAEVLAMHRMLIDLFGGAHGVRDEGLLLSALAQPEATFDGVYLHADVFDMAAAYAFHLVMNHPFLDGNKRVGATAMGGFLAVNGHRLRLDQAELYAMIIATTEGRVEKAGIAAWLRDRAGLRSPTDRELRPGLPGHGPSSR